MGLRDDLMGAMKAIDQCSEAIPPEVLNEDKISRLFPIESRQIGCLQRHADRLESLEQTLQTLLEAVGRQRSRFQVTAPRLHNSQRPAIHLPPEVLSFIFEAACVDGSIIIRRTRNAISGVCFWWRKVVLDNPKLWSNIWGECTNGVFDRPDWGLLSLEIERAGHHPLSLRIDSAGPQMKGWHSIFQQLARSGSQVQSLEIHLLNSCTLNPMDELLSQWSGQLALLRTLIIYFDVDDDSDEEVELGTQILRLEPMPSLEHLIIQYCGDSVLKFESSALNITKLWIEGEVDAAASIQLINACPALVSLVWIGPTEWHTREDELPALQPKASLRCLYVDGDNPSRAISHIRTTCFPALQKLTVKGYVMSSAAAVILFSLHPNLQEINIATEVDSTLVAGFTSLRLPYLQNLRLDWYTYNLYSPNSSPNSVMDILEARKEHTSPFVLHLDHSMQEKPEWKEAAHFLEKCGSNVSLVFRDYFRDSLSPREWLETDM